MKTMTMREFLRGGYKKLDDITVVSVHGRPSFTVLPYQTLRERAHTRNLTPQVFLSNTTAEQESEGSDSTIWADSRRDSIEEVF